MAAARSPPARPGQPVGVVAPDGNPPASAVSYGAVYLATPPNMAYGMVIGQRDRLMAHRQAEIACRASGASCVMAQEFIQPCAAVVEGVRRAPGAFFMTSDPKTYRVRAITYAVGASPADAEREARNACAQREHGALTCRIVQAQCGPR